MDQTLLAELVLLGIVVLFVASLRDPPSFWRQLREQLDQLAHELDRHADRNRWLLRIKVYSAETTHGKEAQFIRERLPRKAPRARYVLALLFIGVLVWWLTR
jgi:hypothetical protein